MNNGTVQRIAARFSLGLSVVFVALLMTLHVLEPEFNSGHLISEYQLGNYGIGGSPPTVVQSFLG